jgi:hypothetical protein
MAWSLINFTKQELGGCMYVIIVFRLVHWCVWRYYYVYYARKEYYIILYIIQLIYITWPTPVLCD